MVVPEVRVFNIVVAEDLTGNIEMAEAEVIEVIKIDMGAVNIDSAAISPAEAEGTEQVRVGLRSVELVHSNPIIISM